MTDATERIGLVWFRRDLRLDDNPAWAAATSSRAFVVPLFVIDPRLLERAGPFRRRQLIANLQALDYSLAELGGRLLVRIGDPAEVVPETIAKLEVDTAHWNADVTPYAVGRDRRVTDALSVPVVTHWGTLVHPPGSVVGAKGALPRVFRPFHKAWMARPREPWPEPGTATIFDDPGEPMPTLDGPAPFFEGEAEAKVRLERFLERVDHYDRDRNRPDLDATSQLSSDLRFGTLSPRAVLEAVGDETAGRSMFVRQLAWRDWWAHLLVEVPDLPTRSLRERFDEIEWRDDPAEIAAWKGGYTGYPIVDAGMRQLRQTGWIHNRVRMIVGSFLVKDLLVDWRIGERHFRYLLVDGDVAQNVGNWQWVAGTGPDASPYHRIFNPVTQSRKFDPSGAYIRRWVPELAELDDRSIHAPWEVEPGDLEAVGITLGDDYPRPLVDHADARTRALAAYTAVGEATSAARRPPRNSITAAKQARAASGRSTTSPPSDPADRSGAADPS
jgi:deoxyribodipyrimidine photo-lyase